MHGHMGIHRVYTNLMAVGTGGQLPPPPNILPTKKILRV